MECEGSTAGCEGSTAECEVIGMKTQYIKKKSFKEIGCNHDLRLTAWPLKVNDSRTSNQVNSKDLFGKLANRRLQRMLLDPKAEQGFVRKCNSLGWHRGCRKLLSDFLRRGLLLSLLH